MSTTSPNMNLLVPTSGMTPGPDYSLQVNTSLSLIDQHDHSPGKGVQITPAGININTALTLNNNLLTNVAGLMLTAQGSTPDIGTLYESGTDLYFVDGLGNNVRITQSGGIAGSPGSISNLVSPASASYVAVNSTFVWQSNTNKSANMDVGSLLIREVATGANAITLSSPIGLSSNFTMTLPSALPASQKFMTLDNSGNIAANWTTDNSTVEISSDTLRVKPGGITATQIANLTVGTGQIADFAITTAKLNVGAVTNNRIALGAVNSASIQNGSIVDAAVNSFADINRSKLRTLTIAANSVMTGSTTNTSGFVTLDTTTLIGMPTSGGGGPGTAKILVTGQTDATNGSGCRVNIANIGATAQVCDAQIRYTINGTPMASIRVSAYLGPGDTMVYPISFIDTKGSYVLGVSANITASIQAQAISTNTSIGVSNLTMQVLPWAW